MRPGIETRRIDEAAHARAVGREAEKIRIIQRPDDDPERSLNIKETSARDSVDAEPRILRPHGIDPRLLARRNRYPAPAKRLDAYGNAEEICEHDRKPRRRALPIAEQACIGKEFAVRKGEAAAQCRQGKADSRK